MEIALYALALAYALAYAGLAIALRATPPTKGNLPRVYVPTGCGK